MPGRCPSCNQTYTDETLSFCPNDGTPLIKETPSSYDPQATMISQPPPNYPPQQQGGYYPPPGGQAPPQGGQTPPPGWQPPPPSYGQQPPYGQQQQYQPQYGAASDGGGSKSKLPIIIAIAAVILIGGGIGLYFLLRDNSTPSSRVDINTNTSTTSNTNRTATTSTTPSTVTVITPSTTTSTTTTTTTADNYTDDEKHKLFQAVGITHDEPLIVEVAQKLGLADSRGMATPAMQPFIKDHFNWAMRSAAWVQEYKDPQKAREYVMAHK